MKVDSDFVMAPSGATLEVSRPKFMREAHLSGQRTRKSLRRERASRTRIFPGYRVRGGTLAPAVSGAVADRLGLGASLWIAASGAVVVFLAALLVRETAPYNARRS
jgi:hypothetical protein